MIFTASLDDKPIATTGEPDPLVAVLLALERDAAEFPRSALAVQRLIAEHPDACEIIAWLAYKETK